MINRYANRKIYSNEEPEYKQLIEGRGLKIINQYGTADYSQPDIDNFARVKTIKHLWVVGDRYYKLAYKYYGSSSDWWMIAMYNNKPTESHIKLGDLIYIPENVQELKRLFNF